MNQIIKYTFTYEHEDGSHGYYIKAHSRKEADALFLLRCEEECIPEDDYGLVRIVKGNSHDGEWLWDIHTGNPLPKEFWYDPKGE